MTAKLKVISSEPSSFTLKRTNTQCCARPMANIAGTIISTDHHGATG